MSTNPAKRRRTELESTDTQSDDEPHRSDIWYEDGNIVLQAGNVQFKVHRSILEKHSPIFSGVFAMPHPDDEPLVDSCPLVHLQDSSKDIQHMLQALYGDRCYYDVRQSITFDAIAAMVRMGRKYEMKELRDEGLHRLQKELPTSLNAFAGTDFFTSSRRNRLGKIKSGQGVNIFGLLFDIIELAHENDIQTILPAAYFLCTDGIQELMLGTTRHDGWTSQVAYDVRQACVVGWGKFLEQQKWDDSEWLDSIPTHGCKNSDGCRAGLTQLVQELLGVSPKISCYFSWYKGNQFKDELESQGVCVKCIEDSMLSHHRRRRERWAELPSYFGLSPWDSLKDFGG